MTPDEVWAQLDEFARTLEPALQRAFRAAIAQARENLSVEALEHMARTGDVSPLLEELDLQGFKLAARDAVLQAALQGQGLPFEVRLDLLSPNTLRAVQLAEATITSSLSSGISAGTKEYVLRGLQNGVNPLTTARELRGVVGLPPRLAQATANYRRLLTQGQFGQPSTEALGRGLRDARFDRSIQRAADAHVPLTPEQLERQVARYQDRALKLQGETVARTQSMDAITQAQRLQWQTAIDEGRVRETDLRRFWYVARVPVVCPICEQIPFLNPEGVAFNEEFKLPDGSTLWGPTAHPNCRCVVFTRILFNKVDDDFFRTLTLRRAA